ncbi:hypothetical protein PanWU01x14_293380, partial [Parasponia andersonii]
FLKLSAEEDFFLFCFCLPFIRCFLQFVLLLSLSSFSFVFLYLVSVDEIGDLQSCSSWNLPHLNQVGFDLFHGRILLFSDDFSFSSSGSSSLVPILDLSFYFIVSSSKFGCSLCTHLRLILLPTMLEVQLFRLF